MSICALTTFDNPYDPIDQFDSWYRFDLDKARSDPSYVDCCSYLDRIAHTSDQLSDVENDQEIERAIDEIIKYDFMNIYKKIKRVEPTETSDSQ